MFIFKMTSVPFQKDGKGYFVLTRIHTITAVRLPALLSTFEDQRLALAGRAEHGEAAQSTLAAGLAARQ